MESLLCTGTVKSNKLDLLVNTAASFPVETLVAIYSEEVSKISPEITNACLDLVLNKTGAEPLSPETAEQAKEILTSITNV